MQHKQELAEAGLASKWHNQPMSGRQPMSQAIVATPKARFDDVLCRQHQLLLTMLNTYLSS